MKYLEILEALRPSQYRPYVKGWNKERYKDIFLNPKYEHDRNGYRVYIPISAENIHVDPEQVSWIIYRQLENKGYIIDDYIKGIAAKKDDPKRKVKIGKLLSPEALQIFANDPRRASSKNKHICVISRHPYDIAGMSTDRGWTSCMNLDRCGDADEWTVDFGHDDEYDGEWEGGYEEEHDYSWYIPLDIEHGTLVAYAVREDDKNIQNPVCRVAIKPFVNSYDPEIVHFGIDESVYGAEVHGFVDAVRKWVDEINDHNDLSEVVVFTLNRELYGDARPFHVHVPDSYSDEERQQIEMVSLQPNDIEKIENPSETVQLTAVQRNRNSLRHIKNPTEKVILTAIRQNAYAARYVDNPSEEFKLKMAQTNGFVLSYFEDPSEKIIWAALKNNPQSIGYVENSSEEMQMYAIKNDINAMHYIRGITDNTLKTFVRMYPREQVAGYIGWSDIERLKKMGIEYQP